MKALHNTLISRKKHQSYIAQVIVAGVELDQTLEGIHGSSQDKALRPKLIQIKYHDDIVNWGKKRNAKKTNRINKKTFHCEQFRRKHACP